ncbi:MAG: pitrilysin family protein [Nannocystaceae bacterium]
MSFFLPSGLTALLLTAAPNPASSPTLPIERYSLNNGLRVVLSEDHSAPIVTLFITYRVGAAQEVSGRTGFAHLFEHMMFNGSANVPEGAYSWYVGATGGVLNGNTEPDRTNYFQTVPSNFLEGMLWLEADRMTSLDITDASLSNEKDVVKEEVRQQQDNAPYAKTLLLEWPQQAFSSWEYAHSIYGSMQDLSNAPAQAFKDFFAQHYVPNNATLVICGDFEPTRAKDLVQKYFGPVPKGPEQERSFPREAPQAAAVYRKVEDRLAQVPLALISWDIPEPRTADRDALELLASLLTEGASARLPKRLIDDDKLAVQVMMRAGFPIPTYGPGQMVTLLVANRDVELEKLRSVLWQELERVQAEGVRMAEMRRAKAKIKKDHLDGLRKTVFKAQQLATYETFYGGADKFPNDYRRYDKIKRKDLQRVAKRYLTKQASVTFDIVPTPARNQAPAPTGGNER